MRAEELYACWAPEGNPWSAWAKPVLFADMPARERELEPVERVVPAAPVRVEQQTAVVVDLPGAQAVDVGLALAGEGYQPVPLFNGCAAPGMVVDVAGLVQALRGGAPVLARQALPADAPPAFLLDAERRGNARTVAPGRFDNRWAVVPQDMPSGSRLRLAGLERVVVVTDRPVADDLAHILRRYREAGLEVVQPAAGGGAPTPVALPKLRGYRSLVYGLFVLAGLRRNAAGGFGSLVPMPGSGGG